MDIEKVRSLVGDVQEYQLEHVDQYIGNKLGVFLPVTGQCGYATTKEHSHPSYSFILCPNSISISGKEIPQSHGQDSLIAMSPGFKHHEDVRDRFVRYFAICIDSLFFEETLKLYQREPIYFANTVFPVTSDLMPIIKSYISEYRDRLPGYERQLGILEERITHLIIRNCLGTTSSIGSISHRFEVEAAIEFIHMNYMNKISVDDVCKSVNYSSSNFSRIFKKEMNRTLANYIIDIRLEKSKKLMEIGKDRLIDISYSCGFNSPAHFSSSFKKSFGTTPSNYQNMVGRKAVF